jgi:hypothetical protein
VLPRETLANNERVLSADCHDEREADQKSGDEREHRNSLTAWQEITWKVRIRWCCYPN